MAEDTVKASTTALGVLATLAVAGTDPDPALRLDDPIAPRLLRWRDGRPAMARVPALHPLTRRVLNRRLPGMYWYGIARIRHMDAVVRQEAAAGLDRIVILGAGYDTRAYRMGDALAGVPVVEVDHPATLREKRKRLGRALDSPAAGVSYLDVDFTHQNLLERLGEHGHELTARTLFVLSGVAYFLPEPTVRELFDQIAAHTSARTSLLFDYFYPEILTEPERLYGAAEWVPMATRVGEEPRSGFSPEEVGAVLADHGLRLDSHLDPEGLANRYLRGSDGSIAGRPIGFGAIAHAFVAT